MKGHLSILLVEDNPSDFVLTRHLLEDTSLDIARIIHVRTVAEIASLDDKAGIAVIILDLRLPDSQGLDTFDAVHRHFPDVPILVMSGLMDQSVAREALQRGAQDYLIKGEISELLLDKAIRYAIERADNLRSLKMSEERYRQLFDLNPQPMYAYDEENLKFLMVNEAAVNHYGYSRAEFMAMTLADIRPFSELERMWLAIKEQRENDTPQVSGDWIHRKKDGSLIEVKILSLRFFIKGHTARLVLIEDITDRKKADEAQQVLTAELLAQNKDLQQFSFIASHNIRGPIANMQGLLSLVDRESLRDEPREIFDNLKISVDQLDTTLNDLVTVLVTKSRANLDAEELRLESIYATIERLLEHQLADGSINVTLDFQEVAVVTYNKVYLESVFLNLVTNAIKYRSPHRDLELMITSHRLPGYVAISFRDNGLGIDLNRYHDRIFGLYQRFHSHKEGKGMGLYITHQQVHSLGGKIEVVSEVGRGTEFTIFIRTK